MNLSHQKISSQNNVPCRRWKGLKFLTGFWPIFCNLPRIASSTLLSSLWRAFLPSSSTNETLFVRTQGPPWADLLKKNTIIRDHTYFSVFIWGKKIRTLFRLKSMPSIETKMYKVHTSYLHTGLELGIWNSGCQSLVNPQNSRVQHNIM